ncbi:proline--tRNA ligase [Halolamina pelagica]|uniref:Proline--tRNA ligase n=1 Tax=Halolamina pelagica TaxID=699431 RepID=A0A0N8I063_9EURY|nr:aminoacyl--tRNA ligase-related protein [Halolamina pelagica]KPN31427.1 proline--tRNA ligase [Halolamina pelagica]
MSRPSHEEGVVHLLDGLVRSYDDLPVVLYQVDAKFRDDHARAGLLRCKEFTMKDAYSAHVDADSLRETYREMRAAYLRLFDDLGLTVAVCGADNSVMGGDRSEEFVAPVAEGSCRLTHCTADGCRWGSPTRQRRSTSTRRARTVPTAAAVSTPTAASKWATSSNSAHATPTRWG